MLPIRTAPASPPPDIARHQTNYQYYGIIPVGLRCVTHDQGALEDVHMICDSLGHVGALATSKSRAGHAAMLGHVVVVRHRFWGTMATSVTILGHVLWQKAAQTRESVSRLAFEPSN